MNADQLSVNVGSVLFYRQLEPFSEEHHGGLGVSLSANPYAFLADTYAVPITADEFEHAALCYPIVFASESKIPVALMGPYPGVNVFVAQDGEMDPEAYVPAFARRYPFLPIATDGPRDPLGGSGRMVLCIDRAAKTISDRPEIPFFEHGQHSRFTRDAIQTCNEFENLARRTRDLIRILEQHDLFERMELRVPRANPDGTEAPSQKIEDCLRISERKLNALPDDVYIKLRNIGVPGLAYAHLLSLGLWPKLLSRAARMNAQAPAY
ncbi:MAG: SapC family protein [Sphingomonas sp.]|uniref:SapC family protein n=1 Tax=Sphingomonas sp. TaxID=28214 RepID=UPI001B2625C5|nr:SapC family protein [Sphingomonas sp.]MBO9624398.1 SapC family protein [Sphingomonas sp.]